MYNLEAGNKHNVFFNKKFFDEQFYGEYDCHIDILPSDEEDDVLSDNLEKEERKEETPGDSSDINIERVRQISEGLEIIESKLKAVQRYRVEIQNKVEYCRACCSSGQQEERKELSTCIEEEKVSEEEINCTASQIPRKVSFAVNSFESEKPISDFNLEGTLNCLQNVNYSRVSK